MKKDTRVTNNALLLNKQKLHERFVISNNRNRAPTVPAHDIAKLGQQLSSNLEGWFKLVNDIIPTRAYRDFASVRRKISPHITDIHEKGAQRIGSTL
jgi:hypothetical protein